MREHTMTQSAHVPSAHTPATKELNALNASCCELVYCTIVSGGLARARMCQRSLALLRVMNDPGHSQHFHDPRSACWHWCSIGTRQRQHRVLLSQAFLICTAVVTPGLGLLDQNQRTHASEKACVLLSSRPYKCTTTSFAGASVNVLADQVVSTARIGGCTGLQNVVNTSSGPVPAVGE
eukprot:m.642862 g.642862  ORF g.642862 m.642862 type:complete len:179 (+) comp22642_c1_seq10:132-668(+)